jgi:hypothetical protein
MEVARPDGPGQALLTKATDTLKLSARGYHRVLRVARTLADLGEKPGYRGPTSPRHWDIGVCGWQPSVRQWSSRRLGEPAQGLISAVSTCPLSAPVRRICITGSC